MSSQLLSAHQGLGSVFSKGAVFGGGAERIRVCIFKRVHWEQTSNSLRPTIPFIFSPLAASVFHKEKVNSPVAASE